MSDKGPLSKLSDEELWARRNDAALIAAARARAAQDSNAAQPAQPASPPKAKPVVSNSDADQSTAPIKVLVFGLVATVIALAVVWACVA